MSSSLCEGTSRVRKVRTCRANPAHVNRLLAQARDGPRREQDNRRGLTKPCPPASRADTKAWDAGKARVCVFWGVSGALSTATPVRRLAIATIIALGFAALMSEYISIHWDSGPAGLDLTKSTLRIRVDVGASRRGYRAGDQWFARGWTVGSTSQHPGTRRWLPSLQTDFWSFGSTAIVLPLWFLVFVVSVAVFGPGMARAWWRWRRGRCVGCGYEVGELTVCPECGRRGRGGVQI